LRQFWMLAFFVQMFETNQNLIVRIIAEINKKLRNFSKTFYFLRLLRLYLICNPKKANIFFCWHSLLA
jgi:hypothetical protein